MVVISRQAQKDLEMIYHYISSEGYPETANKYIHRIFSFIESLSLIGFAQFKPCTNKAWQKRGFECSIFEEKYIIGAIKKFTFFLDPKRTGRVYIKDMLTSPILAEFY